MVVQVGQAALGFTVFDAHTRLQTQEETLRQRIRDIAAPRRYGFYWFNQEATFIWGFIFGVLGGAVGAGRTALMIHEGNLRSVYRDPFVLGGLGAALGTGIVCKAISDVDAWLETRAKTKRRTKVQEKLDALHSLDSTLALQGSEHTALALDDGSFLSILEDTDFPKLSSTQLHAVYKQTPDRFWNACDAKAIDQAKLLPLIKLDQFLHLSKKQLIEALTDQENDLHCIQYPCLLEWLIQDLPESLYQDAKVKEHLQNKITSHFPLPLIARYLEEAVTQIRSGKSIEDLKNMWCKAPSVQVTFTMGQKAARGISRRINKPKRLF